MFYLFVFFFKQKTAYEMRSSDWSSDVCSSDLPARLHPLVARPGGVAAAGLAVLEQCAAARTQVGAGRVRRRDRHHRRAAATATGQLRTGRPRRRVAVRLGGPSQRRAVAGLRRCDHNRGQFPGHAVTLLRAFTGPHPPPVPHATTTARGPGALSPPPPTPA